MAKRDQKYLDTEAMKLGYKQMLDDVKSELQTAPKLTDAIRAIMNDRKTSIEARIKELEAK